ncbi:hypothetical protein K458DRAFT_431156 [Lentithecium fluviatile CBS 122367]|uniref:Uncharacterized protein n=1 Tax=Lentithecium fluviatile CBS 122367 TaxID=1168545 RepID=A0A6G1J3S5_9PLEO|nr:hypothetical protein K458DRAFT_431156 [Lentithecium fluviatile CBS 122367]
MARASEDIVNLVDEFMDNIDLVDKHGKKPYGRDIQISAEKLCFTLSNANEGVEHGPDARTATDPLHKKELKTTINFWAGSGCANARLYNSFRNRAEDGIMVAQAAPQRLRGHMPFLSGLAVERLLVAWQLPKSTSPLLTVLLPPALSLHFQLRLLRHQSPDCISQVAPNKLYGAEKNTSSIQEVEGVDPFLPAWTTTIEAALTSASSAVMAKNEGDEKKDNERVPQVTVIEANGITSGNGRSATADTDETISPTQSQATRATGVGEQSFKNIPGFARKRKMYSAWGFARRP